jgi:RloB-like protein
VDRLARRRAVLAPKPILWAFCEGRTEVDWLQDLHRRFRGVVVRAEGEVGTPVSVVKKAAERLKKLRSGKIASRDEVWAVFDCDEHDVGGALERARALGIGVAFSNPCFELWPLLHLVDHSAWIHRHAAQRALHEHHPAYHHERNPYVSWAEIESQCGVAVARTLRLHRRGCDAEDLLQNPTTTAWMLRERAAFDEKAADVIAEHIRSALAEPADRRVLVGRLAEPHRSDVARRLGF